MIIEGYKLEEDSNRTDTTEERVHFVDNLRVVLTILLICHHASIFTLLEHPGRTTPVEYSKLAQFPLALFIATNKAFLNEAFFFLSGYSISLGMKSKSGLQYLVGRLFKTGLPALFWHFIGRECLAELMVATIGQEGFRGLTYFILDGPSQYVFALVLLDCAFLLAHFAGTKHPAFSPSSLALQLGNPLVRGGCFMAFSAVSVPVSFFRTSAHAFSLDDALVALPNSHIIAYLAGANLPHLRLLPMRPATAALYLGGSLASAYMTLGLASAYWDALWAHIRPATSVAQPVFPLPINPLNGAAPVFLVLWDAIVCIWVVLSLVTVFASVPALGRRWGGWATHTYVQTFVHMVPVALAAQRWHTATGSPLLIAIGGALSGVVGSWIMASGYSALYSAFLCRYQNYIPEIGVYIKWPESSSMTRG